MKKTLLFLFAFSLIGFNSCQKDNLESPGQIPGMGKTPGKLQVKEPFSVPEGIHIIGEISGLNNPAAKSEEKKAVNDSKAGYTWFGSGKFVRLTLTLLNSKNVARTIFFPKGLVWECKSGDYQHALQIQTAWISLPANSSRSIVIDLYCANLGLPSPNQNGFYTILGVTNSKILWNLLNAIGWRKVNYEMIYGTSVAKGMLEGPTYEEITDRLQKIVWNLTDNGTDITADDQAFIESIPELAPEEIPPLDGQSQFPEYFEEFVAGGK